jgi:hypothetical protein
MEIQGSSKIEFPIIKMNKPNFIDLNSFSEKEFSSPPTRKEHARFRRHSIKS